MRCAEIVPAGEPSRRRKAVGLRGGGGPALRSQSIEIVLAIAHPIPELVECGSGAGQSVAVEGSGRQVEIGRRALVMLSLCPGGTFPPVRLLVAA